MVLVTDCDGIGPIDLANKALYADGAPEAVWATLRRECPVYWNGRPDGKGFWAITRYHDAAGVLKRTAVFSSESGMRLDDNRAATAEAAGRLLIVTDAPRHAKLRKVISSAFTPKMTARLEANMRAIVREELDKALSARVCEFTDFAATLPVAVICDLLGVPRADWPFMLKCTRVAFGESDSGVLERVEAHASIMDYYQYLVDERRHKPADDLISVMINGSVDGVPLTDEEIFLNCDGLLSGGNETTRHATVGGLLALMQNPDQWHLAASSPASVTTVVEEILRYTSPAMHVLRTPREDVEVAGQFIRANEPVAVWIPSANRDESVFDDPGRFDVTRTPNPHVAFGVGPHYCLGASLARAELRVLFGELLSAVSRAEPAGRVTRLRSNLIWGYESLPVILRGR